MKRDANDERYSPDSHDASEPQAEEPSDFFEHALVP
jgi:hypothetical protein